MKTTNNNYSKFYLLLILVSALSFSQEAKKTTETNLKNNSTINKSANTNPYFVNNQLEGNMVPLSISGGSNQLQKPVRGALKTKHDTVKNSISNVR